MKKKSRAKMSEHVDLGTNCEEEMNKTGIIIRFEYLRF